MINVSDELLRIVRFFGLYEKDQICCGTVTIPQCVVLQRLLEGERKVSDLAKVSGLSPSAATRLIDGLVTKGFVERLQAEGDRRKVLIQLSELGREEANRLKKITEVSIQHVMGHIPEDKHEIVLESLQLLRHAMEKALQGKNCCGE